MFLSWCTLQARKAAAMLGLHPQTLRRYAKQGQNPPLPQFRRSAALRTLMPICAEHPGPISSATAGSVPPSSVGTSAGKSLRCGNLYPDAEIVTDVAGGLNWQRKGLLSILERLHRGDKLDVVVANRDRLGPGSALNSSSGWSYRTAAQSWFSTSRMPAPNPNSTEDLLAILHTFSCRMHGLPTLPSGNRAG